MTTYICTNCGYEGQGTRLLRGSKGVEMFLWSFLVIPGPFYSLWRRGGRSPDCPNCHMPVLVKLKSDVGYLAKRKFDMELEAADKKVAKVAEVSPKKEAKVNMDDIPRPVPRKVPVDPNSW